METLKFNLGEESRPKIETAKDIPSSLFRELYQKAFQIIDNYIAETDKRKDSDRIIKDSPNNIFAFIGERGSGKTSCMLSVANMLNCNEIKEQGFIRCNKSFLVSENIDPSFFDQKHNILEVIIAKLFISFKKKVEDANDRTDGDYLKSKRDLIEKFQQTRENLSQLLSRDIIPSEDCLEQLVDMAAGTDLQNSMKLLIDAYLKFFDKDILVLPIDDVDLHTQHAYTMVEQLRKYLIHPNVVILLAVKLDQLALVIKLQYVKEFEKLLNQKEPLSMEVIEEMVDRYIGKLVPLAQRLYLPDSSVYFDYPLEVYNQENRLIHSYNSVQEAVTTLIFKKTRYLFYHTKGETSYIVPRYLRELRHIIFFLENMGDYCVSGRPEYNKTAFKKYFFETWCTNNLDNYGQEIINSIIKVTDATIFNKLVLSLLKERFKETVSEIDATKTAPELSYVLKDSNITYNISLGDVLAYIQYIEKISLKSFDRKLLFVIKSIYSMRLYEYYDLVTLEKGSKKKDMAVKVFRNEFMSDYSNYGKLVGGNFINSAIWDIVPKEGAQQMDRARRVINFAEIRTILSQLNKGLKSIKTARRTITALEALRIVEFFALTSSRRYNSKDDNADKSYRTSKEIYYIEEFGRAENVYFDLVSVFYNITVLRRAYRRFDSRLFKLAYLTEGSLLNQLYKGVLDREGVDRIEALRKRRNRFLSWVSIRNVEILEDLIQHLEHDKLRSSKGGGNKAIIADFFDRASSYEIMTYDRNNSLNPYTIDFKFLRILGNIVKNMDEVIFGVLFNKASSVAATIDVDLLVKGMSKKRNLSRTIKRRIFEKYPLLQTTASLKDIVDALFNEEAYTREEVVYKLEELKIQLNG